MDSAKNPKDEVCVGLHSDTVWREVLQLSGNFQHICSGQFRKIDAGECRNELTLVTKPIHQAPYRVGQRSKKIHDAQINCMRDAGVIEPTLAERAGPVVLVPKKSGTLRSFVDFRW